MENNKNILREETINFAIEISDICDNIKGCSVYINQLLRCSSSIGANLHEAKYAQSKADFISKLEISLKESFETEYWLELLFRKNKMDEITYKSLLSKCGTIRRKLNAWSGIFLNVICILRNLIIYKKNIRIFSYPF